MFLTYLALLIVTITVIESTGNGKYTLSGTHCEQNGAGSWEFRPVHTIARLNAPAITDDTCSNGSPTTMGGTHNTCFYGVRSFVPWCEHSIQVWSRDDADTLDSNIVTLVYYATTSLGQTCSPYIYEGTDDTTLSQNFDYYASNIEASADFLCLIEDEDETENNNDDDKKILLTSCFFSHRDYDFELVESDVYANEDVYYGGLHEEDCSNGLPNTDDYKQCVASHNYYHLYWRESDTRIYLNDATYGTGATFNNERDPNFQLSSRYRIQFLCANFESYNWKAYNCKFEGDVDNYEGTDSVTNQVYHQFTKQECGGSLPSGDDCLAFLRSKVHKGDDYSWLAIGPEETIHGITGPGVTYQVAPASGSDDIFYDAFIEVDYLCPL